MPKIVNHEERREQLADSVLAVIRRSGLSRATLREVAREVGWTSGVLLHYFRDKQELLTFAFELAHRRIRERVDERNVRLSGLAALRGLMQETLPIDEERHLYTAIFLSFEGHAAGVPEIAAQQQAQYEGMHQKIQLRIEEARDAGEVPAEVNSDRAAASCAATIIGLRTMALINPDHYTRDFMFAVVDDVVARLAGAAPELTVSDGYLLPAE